MKPIYFPFTFISETLCGNFHTFFPRFVLYHPSDFKIPESYRKWAEEGRIELRAPLGGDEDRLEKLVREYKEWLDRNRGSEMTFLKTRLFDSLGIETVPMFGETSTSQIKADIKRGRSAPDAPKPDQLFAIRLFLLVAHAFDEQQYELSLDLEQFQGLEKNLLAVMRGDDEEDDEEILQYIDLAVADDPGQHKTAQRVASWLALFEQAPEEPDENGCWCFITASEAVLDQIPAYYTGMPPVYSTGPVDLAERSSVEAENLRNLISENLGKLSENATADELAPLAEKSANSANFGQLKVFAFPGKTPRTLFEEEPGGFEPANGETGDSSQKVFVAKFEYSHSEGF